MQQHKYARKVITNFTFHSEGAATGNVGVIPHGNLNIHSGTTKVKSSNATEVCIESLELSKHDSSEMNSTSEVDTLDTGANIMHKHFRRTENSMKSENSIGSRRSSLETNNCVDTKSKT